MPDTSGPVIDYPANLAGRRAAYSATRQGEKGNFPDVRIHVIP